MNTIKFIIFALAMSSLAKIQAQCNKVETISICDMAIIDGDGNGTPDGIINLYDVYNALSGVMPISLTTGTWFDPGFNFALDEITGDLYLWDIDNSSVTLTDHQFQLIDPSSSCTEGILISLTLNLGPFEGNPLPPQGANDANVTICETVLLNFDLFQVFESQPSPHKNGVWSFVGNLGATSNFISLTPNGKFQAEIPYVPVGNLIEFDVFEFTYMVPGISPCISSRTSNFKVEVIRDVDSGIPSVFEICETDLLLGLWDADINLRDDRFLGGEDIEGLWSSMDDATKQISGPLDSSINIKQVYDFLKVNNPKFGCQNYTYTYTVNPRSSLSDCKKKESSVSFTIYEAIKPFMQINTLEICVGLQPNTLNLYNQLSFTKENGFLYDYPNVLCTNWELISGPSSLGLVSNMGILCEIDPVLDSSYTSLGTLNLANLTNADAGTYVFRFEADAGYTCSSSNCNGQFADVTLVIYPKNYAGEDTTGLQFCEADQTIAGPLDLFTMLNTNGTDDPIYKGSLGTWEDGNTGTIITNPIILPQINDQQTFNFVYRTTTAEGCTDKANIMLTVFESYQSGGSSMIDVCEGTPTFNLFNKLTGSPNNNGTWTGPNGFTTTTHTAIFNPTTSDAGVYTYSVPENMDALGVEFCSGNSATVTITRQPSPNAGNDGSFVVCRSDSQIDLQDYVGPSADPGGVFIDLEAANILIGSLVDVSQLGAGINNFQYQIQGHASCNLSSAEISIIVQDVALPTTGNQTFCVSDGATISSLQASNGLDYNWYDTATSTEVLSFGALLINREDYFVAALDNNGCESPRVSMMVSVLPINHVDCDDCIKDGISVNGDNENDEFDLCNFSIAFPNFEIRIFNRYGTIVYKGNQNTPLKNTVIIKNVKNENTLEDEQL